MADGVTTGLGIRKPEVGVKTAWGGDDGLNEVIDAFDEAVSGVTTKSLNGNATLTSTQFEENEVRDAVLVFTDGGLSSSPTITVPAKRNNWHVKNSTAYDIIISAGGTTATVRTGKLSWVYCDGTDCFVDDPTLDTIKAPSSAVSMNSQKMTGLANGTASTDAVNKGQLDALVSDANVATVAAISSDVTTVAGVSSDVTTTASNATSISTVAADISNVNSVGADIGEVNTVAGSISSVNTVAANITAVQDTGSNIAAVSTVSTNIAAVNTTSSNISDVIDVAADISSVVTCAANIADLQNAASLVTYASQAQAEAGTATDVMMNPLRTKQAIDALAVAGEGDPSVSIDSFGTVTADLSTGSKFLFRCTTGAIEVVFSNLVEGQSGTVMLSRYPSGGFSSIIAGTNVTVIRSGTTGTISTSNDHVLLDYVVVNDYSGGDNLEVLCIEHTFSAGGGP